MNEAIEIFSYKKTEGVFSILIEKCLWRDESKFRKFFSFESFSEKNKTYKLNGCRNLTQSRK